MKVERVKRILEQRQLIRPLKHLAIRERLVSARIERERHLEIRHRNMIRCHCPRCNFIFWKGETNERSN